MSLLDTLMEVFRLLGETQVDKTEMRIGGEPDKALKRCPVCKGTGICTTPECRERWEEQQRRKRRDMSTWEKLTTSSAEFEGIRCPTCRGRGWVRV